MNGHRFPLGLAYGTGAVVVAAILGTLFDNGVLGNDFAQMVSVARNLLAGYGLQTDLIYYDVHYAMSAPSVAQTVFPPGQAILVAALMALGLPSHTAALAFSLLAFLWAGWLLVSTVGRTGVSNTTVLIVMVTWLIVAVNWSNVLACRSESLFIAMTVFGLHSFVHWANGGCKSRRLLVQLGAAAAIAFLFRYQGLFFITASGLYFLARYLKTRHMAAFLDLVAVCVLPGIVVLATLAYNLSVTGGVGGGPVDHTQHSAGILPVALGYYYEISKILGISKEGLLRAGASEIFAIGLFVYAAFISWRAKWHRPFWESDTQSKAILFCAVYVGLSAIVFGYLSLTKSTGYTQARYLSTLLPFVILILALLGHRLFRLLRPNPWQGLLGLALIAGFIGFGQATAISEQLASLADDSRLREIRVALAATDADGNSIADFLQSEIAAGNYVLANQSQLVGHILERQTFGLTPALFTSRKFDFPEVQDMAEELGIRYVILFPTLYDQTAPQNANRIVLTELANGNYPDWIVPVFEAPNLRLYRIDQDREPGN